MQSNQDPSSGLASQTDEDCVTWHVHDRVAHVRLNRPSKLPDLVGRDVARELTFTGRVVEGCEAAQLGLATKAHESPVDVATGLADQIAARNPDAIRAAKALLDSAGRVSLAEQLISEQVAVNRLIGSVSNRRRFARGWLAHNPSSLILQPSRSGAMPELHYSAAPLPTSSATVACASLVPGPGEEMDANTTAFRRSVSWID